MELHPIMYVPDQYAERDFYRRLGFADFYEGEEFPGFLAVRHGAAIIGLQRASAEHPPYREGLRWQFELASVAELDQLVATCTSSGLTFEEQTEVGGTRFRTRLLRVRAPSGIDVWFEGPNEGAR